MQKRTLALVLAFALIILMISISFASAFGLGDWFKGVFGKMMGKAVDDGSKDSVGDLNGDGVVDDTDVDILSGSYGGSDCSAANSWCNNADINKDGKVDNADEGILEERYYSGSSGSSAVKNIYEENETDDSAWCNNADVNKNGKVDDYDVDIISGEYGRTDCSAGNRWCSRADINRDGQVDDGDYADILAANYGREGCISASGASGEAEEEIETENVESEDNSWCNNADINKDGKVDDADVDIISGGYGKSDCSIIDSFCDMADVNKDGAVNDIDEGILESNYGRNDCGFFPVGCIESDGGLNYFLTGLTSSCSEIECEEFQDYCNDKGNLIEGTCLDNYQIERKEYSCINDKKICSFGACIDANPYATCIDSDDGLNFAIKGNITGTYTNGQIFNFTDSCEGTFYLAEFYCEGLIPKKEYYECQDWCSDGTCALLSYNVNISIATLKDDYEANESIYLTDPPESSAKKDFVSDSISGRAVSEEDNTLQSESADLTIENRDSEDNKEGRLYGEGYIIEFKKEPIVIKESEIRDKEEIGERGIAEQVRDYGAELVESNSKNKEEIVSAVKRVRAEKKSLLTGNAINNGEGESFFSKFLSWIGMLRITGRAVDGSEEEDIIKEEYNLVFNGVYANISADESSVIEKLPMVKAVYPNLIVSITLSDSVPLINADDVWQLDKNGNSCIQSGGECLTGKNVTIAIIDTGVDYTHPDLGGCFGAGCKVVGGHDFANNDNNPMDDQGHGTHVAAIAAGNGTLKGVAPDAKILAYKVLDSKGVGYINRIIASVERAVRDDADIISMSLGATCYYYDKNCGPDDAISKAVDNAVAAGVVAVVASGNSGYKDGDVASPGTAIRALSVGAVDKQKVIAYFSSRGVVSWDSGSIIKPDVVAPGVNICAAKASQNKISGQNCLDSNHLSISGTSMATPHVSGVAALIEQKHPDWTPDEIKNAIKNSAEDLRNPVTTQGSRIVNAFSAVNARSPAAAQIIAGSGVAYNNMEFRGNAKGQGFDSYKMFYGKGNSYADSYVEFAFSRSRVNDGILGVLDTDGLENGFYIIKLEVYGDEGIIGRDYTRILVSGGKFKSYPASQLVFSSGIAEDFDADGKKELFAISGNDYYTTASGLATDNKIHAWNLDGSNLYNFPREISGRYTFYVPVSAWAAGNPIIYDLDGDGDKEIAVNSYDAFYAWDKDGNIEMELDNKYKKIVEESVIRDGRLGNVTEFYGIIITTPSVYDIDGDGKMEIIGIYTYNFSAFMVSASTYAGNRNIQMLSFDVFDSEGKRKWSKNCSGGGLSASYSPTIADLNGDGKAEVIALCNKVLEGGKAGNQSVYVWDADGNPYPGNWPRQLYSPVAYYGGVVADFDLDGNKEIAFGVAADTLGSVYAEDSTWYRYLFDENGNDKKGWPIKSRGCMRPSLSVGNLDSDPELEILESGCGQNISIYNHDGSIRRFGYKEDSYSGLAIAALANLDYDNESEIIIGHTSLTSENNASDKIMAFNADGSIVDGFPIIVPLLDTLDGTGYPFVGDVDGDEKIEIFKGAGIFMRGAGGAYLIETDYNYNKEADWPMFQHDYQYTGCYDCQGLPKAIRPQSKIVNNEQITISGRLVMGIDKLIDGNWTDLTAPISKEIAMEPGQTVKLDAEWNPNEISLNENILPDIPGRYRVYALFNYGRGAVNSSWEFNVI